MIEFNDLKKTSITCGIAITWNNSILLVRSTNYDTWYVPKGLVDSSDNDFIETAIREVHEETSVAVSPEMISNPKDPIIVDYKSLYSGKPKRAVIYHCPIESLSELGIRMNKPSIDISYLQKEEVDVALFVHKSIAEKLINPELVDIVRKINF